MKVYINIEICVKKNRCSIIHNDQNWKQMWPIYTMAYYLSIKRNQVPIHAATCLDPNRILETEGAKHKISYAV